MGCSQSTPADTSAQAPAAAPAAAAAAAPAAAVSSPAAALAMANSPMITVDLDGSMISFDKVRRQMIVTSKTGSVMTMNGIPACPNKPGAADAPSTKAEDLKAMSFSGYSEKLGHRKNAVMGGANWQKRFVKLSNHEISYYENDEPTTAPKGVITLAAGCKVKVIQAHEMARKDRYDDNDSGGLSGAVGMLNAPIGSHLDPISSTPIGKPNCVELHVPAQIGNMLGGVLTSSPLALAAGGAAAAKKNIARTYYFSCETEQMANEWCKAIENNVRMIVDGVLAGAPAPTNNPHANVMAGVSGVNMAQLDGALAQAQSMQADQANAKDPSKSLGWYRRATGSSLDDEALYAKVIKFYEHLRAAGVQC